MGVPAHSLNYLKMFLIKSLMAVLAIMAIMLLQEANPEPQFWGGYPPHLAPTFMPTWRPQWNPRRPQWNPRRPQWNPWRPQWNPTHDNRRAGCGTKCDPDVPFPFLFDSNIYDPGKKISKENSN